MRRSIRAPFVLAAATLFISVSSPAQAAPAGGTCPGPFEAYTLGQFVDLAESVGVSRESAERTFEFYNKNEDRIICVQDLTTEKKPDKYNFIDNNAR